MPGDAPVSAGETPPTPDAGQPGATGQDATGPADVQPGTPTETSTETKPDAAADTRSETSRSTGPSSFGEVPAGAATEHITPAAGAEDRRTGAGQANGVGPQADRRGMDGLAADLGRLIGPDRLVSFGEPMMITRDTPSGHDTTPQRVDPVRPDSANAADHRVVRNVPVDPLARGASDRGAGTADASPDRHTIPEPAATGTAQPAPARQQPMSTPVPAVGTPPTGHGPFAINYMADTGHNQPSAGSVAATLDQNLRNAGFPEGLATGPAKQQPTAADGLDRKPRAAGFSAHPADGRAPQPAPDSHHRPVDPRQGPLDTGHSAKEEAAAEKAIGAALHMDIKKLVDGAHAPLSFSYVELRKDLIHRGVLPADHTERKDAWSESSVSKTTIEPETRERKQSYEQWNAQQRAAYRPGGIPNGYDVMAADAQRLAHATNPGGVGSFAGVAMTTALSMGASLEDAWRIGQVMEAVMSIVPVAQKGAASDSIVPAAPKGAASHSFDTTQPVHAAEVRSEGRPAQPTEATPAAKPNPATETAPAVKPATATESVRSENAIPRHTTETAPHAATPDAPAQRLDHPQCSTDVTKFTTAFNDSQGQLLNQAAHDIKGQLKQIGADHPRNTVAVSAGLVDGHIKYLITVTDTKAWTALKTHEGYLPKGFEVGPKPIRDGTGLPTDQHVEITGPMALKEQGAKGVVVGTTIRACIGSCEPTWRSGVPDVWHTHRR
ncbi:MAG TPA: hypothetical protein VGL06_11440 [Pseudonocardiaceae bacterium]